MRKLLLIASAALLLPMLVSPAVAERCRDMPEGRCLSCCKRDGSYSPDQCANFCKGRGAGGKKRSDIILQPKDALALLKR
jgi:hypothetical protein